jgi:hypothetical protein
MNLSRAGICFWVVQRLTAAITDKKNVEERRFSAASRRSKRFVSGRAPFRRAKIDPLQSPAREDSLLRILPLGNTRHGRDGNNIALSAMRPVGCTMIIP